jgi:LmbE family N-acetylglucosaminyl deacetylase
MSSLGGEISHPEQQSATRFTGARVTVIIAHYDDETLFCGGLLSGIRPLMAELALVIVTSVETTSAPREITVPEPSEIERRRRRVAGFRAVCSDLGARSLELHVPNLPQKSTREQQEYWDRVHTVQRALLRSAALEDADMVITHGFAGEYGHPQHCCVHDAVISLAYAAGLGEIWTFSCRDHADVTYRHDMLAKLRLLEHYRRQRIDGTLWAPESDARMREWTGIDEWYRIQRAVKG